MALPKEPAELEARLLRAIEALRLIENSLTAVIARVNDRPAYYGCEGKTVAGLVAVTQLAARLAAEVGAEVSS